VGDGFEGGVAEGEDFGAEAALELLGGGAEGEGGAGADDIHDRLGAGEVDFAIEKRALGKLARFGGAGTVAEDEFEDFRGEEDAAVAPLRLVDSALYLDRPCPCDACGGSGEQMTMRCYGGSPVEEWSACEDCDGTGFLS
jgi:hypothetical protein